MKAINGNVPRAALRLKSKIDGLTNQALHANTTKPSSEHSAPDIQRRVQGDHVHADFKSSNADSTITGHVYSRGGETAESATFLETEKGLIREKQHVLSVIDGEGKTMYSNRHLGVTEELVVHDNGAMEYSKDVSPLPAAIGWLMGK